MLFCTGILAVVAAAAPPADLADALPEGVVLRLGSARLRSGASQMLFTPDGRTLITLDRSNGVVQRWDAETGALREALSLPQPRDWDAALSPDGSLMVRSDDEGLVVCDSATGGRVCRIPARALFGTTFTGDGLTVVTWGYEEPLRCWDARTGKPRDFPGPAPSSDSVRLSVDLSSPDGGRLLVRVNKGTVFACLDAASGREIWRLSEKEQPGWAAFSPDGAVLAVCVYPADKEDQPGDIRFLRAPDGKPADGLTPPPALKEIYGLQFSPDGTALAYRTDKAIVVWDLKAGKARRTLTLPPGCTDNLMAFAPDGKTLTALANGVLHRWDLANGKDLYADVPRVGHSSAVAVVAWSPDGRRIATVSRDRDPALCVWDAGTGKLIRAVDSLPRAWGPAPVSVAFSPDGKRLYWQGGDETIRCLDSDGGKESWSAAHPERGRKEYPGHLGRLHLTADGARLIALSETSAVSPRPKERLVWDAATGELLRRSDLEFVGRGDALSPDGRLRVAAGGRLFDDAVGVERRTLTAKYDVGGQFAGAVGAFSPDGLLFAAALTEDKMHGHRRVPVCRGLQVWEAETGRPLAAVPEAAFGELAFSPDGRTIAVAGGDGVRAWNALTGREIFRRPVGRHLLGDWGATPAFSPDGRRLAVGLTDGTAAVWELPAASRPAPAADQVALEVGDAVWDTLAADDAAAAYAAVDRLAAWPAPGIRLLRTRLKPAPGDPKALPRLLADLDDDDFTVRDEAARRLAGRAEEWAPALRDALDARLGPEAHARVRAALAASPAVPSPERLRERRAVRALEQMGTPEARALLEKLADGCPDAALTREARDALARLASRQ
jgi:WD40 repeat protein